MAMPSTNTTARIDSLRRYIALLQQEEKRLKWIITSTDPPNPEHTAAENNVRLISSKLLNAERELNDLERGKNR